MQTDDQSTESCANPRCDTFGCAKHDQTTPADGLADELARALIPLLPLLKSLTVRQVIEAGEEAIDAAGLNPWCLNEGLAEGHEQAIGQWKIDAILADLETLRIQPDTNAREDALREAAHIASEHEPKLLSESDIITAEGGRTAADAIAEKILALINNPTGDEGQ